jgi:succinylglutamate desuccinylase
MGGALQAFAAGDLAPLARALESAPAARGAYALTLPAPGVLGLRRGDHAPRARIALTVGVHGDETAPIELVFKLLADIAASGEPIGCDLLLAVANLEAIAAGRRFIATDMNRLFRKGIAGDGGEAQRAASLRACLQEFFGQGSAPALHLDLHTTIKPSLFPRFAVIPAAAESPGQALLLDWLGTAGIGVAVHNTLPAGTCSSFTANTCGALAATLELGTVGVLGKNDLGPLAPVAEALRGLLVDGPASVFAGRWPRRFVVSQEIRRRSERFLLHVAPDAPNFTAFERGAVIAEDDAGTYVARDDIEYIVFPNATVAVGQRAGLMVRSLA